MTGNGQLPMTLDDANSVTIVVDASVAKMARKATPAVLTRMIEIATKGESLQAAVAAGKLILGIAGHVAPAPSKPSGATGKQLSELTPAELKAMIDKNESDVLLAERILSDKARPVNAPNQAIDDLEPLDMLD